MEFTIPKMKQIFKKESTLRVSEGGAEELAKELEGYAEDRVDEALQEMKKDGRKTLRKEDLKAGRDLVTR